MDFNAGSSVGRRWAEPLAASGQLHGRHWAGSHGRRQRNSWRSVLCQRSTFPVVVGERGAVKMWRVPFSRQIRSKSTSPPALGPNRPVNTFAFVWPVAGSAHGAPDTDTPTSAPATDPPPGPRARTTTCADPTPDSHAATEPPAPPPPPVSGADTNQASATDPPTRPNPSTHTSAAIGGPSGGSPRTAAPPPSPQRRRAAPPTPLHTAAPPHRAPPTRRPPPNL